MPTVKKSQFGEKVFVNLNTKKEEKVFLSANTSPSEIKGLVLRGAPRAWFDDDRSEEPDSLKKIAEKGSSNRVIINKKTSVKAPLIISKRTKAKREAAKTKVKGKN